MEGYHDYPCLFIILCGDDARRKAQAVYDKYLDNGIFGMAFFFVLVGFGIGIHYHKKFINLNKKNYLEFLGKKLGILYPLYMIMQTVFLILALCTIPVHRKLKH